MTFGSRPRTRPRASEVPHGVCGSGAILAFMCFMTSDGKTKPDELPTMTPPMGRQARGGAHSSTFFDRQLPSEAAAQWASWPGRPIRAPRHAAATFIVHAKLFLTWHPYGAHSPCSRALWKRFRAPLFIYIFGTFWLAESGAGGPGAQNGAPGSKFGGRTTLQISLGLVIVRVSSGLIVVVSS